MDAKELVASLIAADDSRDRSKQTAVGVSSLGDCKRKVWHMSKGDAGTNATLRLPAILGTAIHAAIEKALPQDGALIEHRVEIDGYPPATIDYYRDGEVIDWKTIKLSGAPYFVSKQKRWQIQTYGYLLSLQGYEVKQVTLIGIPRDGTENDIITYSEPYDPQIALDAFDWLREVQAAETAPAPEREPISFCSNYCQFYGSLCAGITKDLSGEPIADPQVAEAALTYKELSAQIKQLETQKDAVKAQLEGQAGITFDGIKISWSQIDGRKTPDLDAIEKLLGDVPMKQGAASMRLTVK